MWRPSPWASAILSYAFGMPASSSSVAAARVSIVMFSALVAVASCKASTDDGASSTPAADAGDDDAGVDSGRCAADAPPSARTFDPSGYDRTCTADSDCIVVSSLTPTLGSGQCEISCCGGYAVRASATVTADRTRVTAACCGFYGCTKGCGESRAVCDHGECRFVDPYTAPFPDAGSDADASDAATD